jgi:hypothetical protein
VTRRHDSLLRRQGLVSTRVTDCLKDFLGSFYAMVLGFFKNRNAA